MSEDKGRVNKQFGEEVKRYERAFMQGTPERKIRQDYPGEAARSHVCTDPICLNNKSPAVTTFFLCASCSAVAPDTVRSLTHAPFKVLPPKQKRQQANAAAFAAWCRARHKKEKFVKG